MSVQKSMQVLQKCAKYLDIYDLKKPVAVALEGALKSRAGVMVKVHPWQSIYYPFLNITRPFTCDVDAAVSDLKAVLKSKNLTLENAHIYFQADRVLDRLRLAKNRKLKGEGIIAAEMLYLIRYLLKGYFDDGYTLSNEWLVRTGHKPNATSFEFEYEGIQVRGFKNGRIDLKGLSDEHYGRLFELTELKSKIKRMNVSLEDQL